MNYEGLPVLVTGHTGFLGRHLCRELESRGAQVRGLSRGSGIELGDEGAIRKIVADCRPRYVFHLAASLLRDHSAEAVRQAHAVNVEGTRALLAALADHPPARIILAGTADVYGNGPAPYHEQQPLAPSTPYAASKAAAWLLALASGLPVVEARLFLLYGPGQDERFFLPQLLSRWRSGQALEMTLGEQARDFVWVGDAVESLLRLAEAPAGQAYNVCTGVETPIREVVQLLAELASPGPGVKLGALPYREGELFHIVGYPDRLREAVGYGPQTKLRDGLQQCLGGSECK